MKEESKAGRGVRQSNGEQSSQEFITSVRCSLIVGHLEHALEYLQESLKRKAPHATKRTESQQIQPEMVQEVMLGLTSAHIVSRTLWQRLQWSRRPPSLRPCRVMHG